jgi:hypothetical protein
MSAEVATTEPMFGVCKMPRIWPLVPVPLITCRSTWVAKVAVRSRKITSSNAIGDWSISWIATPCWPLTVRTGALMNESLKSVWLPATLSPVWTATVVPVSTLGMLMESVPPGSGWRCTKFAKARPGLANSIYWLINQAGGTAYPPDPSTRLRSRSSM